MSYAKLPRRLPLFDGPSGGLTGSKVPAGTYPLREKKKVGSEVWFKLDQGWVAAVSGGTWATEVQGSTAAEKKGALSMPTVAQVLAALQAKGMDPPTEKPLMIGLRMLDFGNDFDDVLGCMWKTADGSWQGDFVQGTTDPGDKALEGIKANPAGAAHVEPGLHVDCWAPGLHKWQEGRLALRQVGPMAFRRSTKVGGGYALGAVQNGVKGLNFHDPGYANATGRPIKHSSHGCQVPCVRDEQRRLLKHVTDYQERTQGPVQWSNPEANIRVSYALFDVSDPDVAQIFQSLLP